MPKLDEWIHARGADIEAIGAWLDGLDHESRISATVRLAPKDQRRLWILTAGRRATLDQFVPPHVSPLEPVRHHGRNTLPVFTRFEKRFCRPPIATGEPELWGYNEGVTRPVVGPGYFVVRETPGDGRGDVVIDYCRVPPSKPTDWPTIRANDQGPSRFVYGGMHDFMRRVSEHVTIGRAFRKGKAQPAYFVLCRER